MTVSSALAALLLVAQVSTSSTAPEACTPTACRVFRAGEYLWKGIAEKRGAELRRLEGEVSDGEARIAVLERADLNPRPCPEAASPAWSGWPYVLSVAFLAVFGVGVAIGRSVAPVAQ